MWPAVFYRLGLQLFPKDIPDFFYTLVHGVFKNRNFTPSTRKDFVDLVLNLRQNEYLTCDSLLKSKKGEKVSVKVDDNLLVAQCVLYFSAGYETSATASSFTLYHLAKDQKIQERAFEEVDGYLRKKNGKVEYDCVSELPYLEACVDEALRMYPPLGVITREVMETYVLPDGLELEKGMRVHLPVYHLHRCEKYFRDPEEYEPERFLPENKGNIQQYTYMPFGEGQRICVGIRVAKMMMLPGLIAVLRKFRVELAEGTPQKLTLESRAMVTQSADALRLKFIPRKST
ncbi:cytochrome p450 domain-containing protein [Phthorimaea operculella]|nr:cytochrome p450 domain-containing protein [Phthorimaea operculella]